MNLVWNHVKSEIVLSNSGLWTDLELLFSWVLLMLTRWIIYLDESCWHPYQLSLIVTSPNCLEHYCLWWVTVMSQYIWIATTKWVDFLLTLFIQKKQKNSLLLLNYFWGIYHFTPIQIEIPHKGWLIKSSNQSPLLFNAISLLTWF